MIAVLCECVYVSDRWKLCAFIQPRTTLEYVFENLKKNHTHRCINYGNVWLDLYLKLLYMYKFTNFPSVLWHCWWAKGKASGLWKNWVLVCWWWRFDWSFARLIAAVVTTTSIILSSNKSIMEMFWYRLNQVHLDKWPLNWREREK